MGEARTGDTEAVAGVIGGMGPEATVELMRRVIAATPARDDAGHIHLLVDNNPKVPSRIKALIEGTGEDPAPTLIDMARRLESAGADFLVIPCNTAHYYWRQVAQAVDVPVWHIVKLTLRRAATSVGTPMSVGMLASPALRRVRLYEAHCAAYGASLIYPEDEETLLTLIRAVKAGRFGDAESAQLNSAASRLVDAGADVLVLGCTEFSLVAKRLAVTTPVIDSLQVLAEEIVARVKG